MLAKDTNLPPIVRLVNLILSDAAAAGASDIHIEPQESFLKVRQRVDGLLREVLTVPAHLQDQTISRFKIISGMDIAERRKPQDGRSRLRFEGRRIDLRVSTLPTQYGEKIVIRLLNSDKAILPLDELGFSPGNLRAHAVVPGAAARNDPRDRADRQRQDIHALYGAQVDQVADQQHHHARRPDRAPDRRASTRCRSTSRPA